VQLSRQASVDDNLLRYINRLSDYLFVLSRKMNKIENKEEILWKKTC
jgi:cob(I)alamin adenosyltransferase